MQTCQVCGFAWIASIIFAVAEFFADPALVRVLQALEFLGGIGIICKSTGNN
jgi:hypothetical protein